jgi:uncharacterized protein YndB with AHSA1/START domain
VAREYAFVDEWDVRAEPEAAFDALADSRTYVDWWQPVYLEVETDGPPRVGGEARHVFTGRLPYKLRTHARMVEMDRPRSFRVEVDGDLRGTGVWTLTPRGDGRTHLRFDWTVHADRPLLRYLTPLLRPLFRANHNWAIARAREGHQPYLDGLAADPLR